MFYVVTGGSGSGKSAFAEDLICRNHDVSGTGQSGDSLIYIATMVPYGEETKRKIRRHREMRMNKGFSTIECYTGLDALTENGGLPSADAADCPGELGKPSVLLECMSNLVANEIYEPGGAGNDTAAVVLSGIEKLRKQCRHLVVVTNEICSESAEDSSEMILYKKMLAKINRGMSAKADGVAEVVYGIPAFIKGQIPEYLKQEGKGNIMQKEAKEGGSVSSASLKMVIGGAYQGKRNFAEKTYGTIQWADGADCPLEALYTCRGIFHFEQYIKRRMQSGDTLEGLADSIARRNPERVIVTREIGYGLVPVDAFERDYREKTGRICTELAAYASRVDRVICGIGVLLKGERES